MSNYGNYRPRKGIEPESHRQKGLTPLARKWLKGGTRSLDTGLGNLSWLQGIKALISR